ncbi:group 10 secretory phospholipase A2 isoform X1 [Bos indicus]|uniref:Phospholipase A2 n=1 Tax=Bos indicus TaxID=9915 RepID=A0A6P5DZ97_BOSIN|nr:group 10 secretory phospholipase A2 isoform X1 [Bos taurus]XP_019843364.1 PREDICTED: group 10 secretory phospholipase A2 isoform X1 [Bos indicus]XP_027382270.1 group 10 secretory phospholipase A2-like isoform X1 [Bos indicus x Bos taurus]
MGPMAPLPLCPKVGLLLLLLLGSEPGLRAAPQRSHVHRRGLIGLAGTIDCVGPRPALVYVKYGCFCGLGGHGQPQDAIDWCCHAHDCCYTHAENSGCNPKLQPYSWNCVSQSVKCDFSGKSFSFSPLLCWLWEQAVFLKEHLKETWREKNQRRTNAKNSYASVTRSLLTA